MKLFIVPLLAMVFAGANESYCMDFVVDKALGKKINANVICGDGQLHLKDGEKLNTLLHINKIDPKKRNIIILNSEGGNLVAGVTIGYLLSEYSFTTAIGRVIRSESNEVTILSGKCSSACSYAYIGGKKRFVSSQDKIGLHRFTKADGVEAEVNDLLAKITRKAGVSDGFMELARNVSSSAMYNLNCEDIERLKVATEKCGSRINKLPYFGSNANNILQSCVRAYKENGLSGLIALSHEAYANIDKSFSFAKLEICMTIDIFSSAFDRDMARILGFPADEYFIPESFQKRIIKYLLQQNLSMETSNALIAEIENAVDVFNGVSK